MAKSHLFGQAARLKLFGGVEILAQFVGATMGANGRHIFIDKGKHNDPVATRDGVSVAKEVQLSDPEMELGRRIAYEACEKTNKAAGDATTCAAVLMHAMMEEGMKHVIARRNVIHIGNGMKKASAAVIDFLTQMGQHNKIENPKQLADVAMISAQDKEIGEKIAEIVERVGKDGTVLTETRQGAPGIELNVIEGMRLDRGWVHQLFITNPARVEFDLEDVYVLVTDARILSQDQIVPMMELLARHYKSAGKGKPRVLVIAPHFEGTGLDFFVQNRMHGMMECTLVMHNAYGEYGDMLEDIAIATGGTFFSERLGRSLPTKQDEATVEGFGLVKRAIVTKDTTTLIGGAGDKKAIEERVQLLRNLMESEENAYQKGVLGDRIARLVGKVGIVRVGASTEIAAEDKRLRMDDALCATRAAIKMGIVPGGGVAMLRALSVLDDPEMASNDDEQIGIEIVKIAIQKPAWQIATNAGEKGDVVIDNILHPDRFASLWENVKDAIGLKTAHENLGFNLTTREYVDMVAAGIIDPAMALICALENATDVASMMLTGEGLLVDIPESTQPADTRARR